MNFLNIPPSLKILYPKNRLIIAESWNSAKAVPTSILENTILVENCIVLKHIAAIKYFIQSVCLGCSNFLPKRGINIAPKTSPEKHQRIKEIWGDERSMIFFKILASKPVNKRAINLKPIERHRFLVSRVVLVGEIKHKLPNTIKITPPIAIGVGNSPNNKNALIKPIIDLYEFKGPKIDNSP